VDCLLAIAGDTDDFERVMRLEGRSQLFGEAAIVIRDDDSCSVLGRPRTRTMHTLSLSYVAVQLPPQEVGMFG